MLSQTASAQAIDFTYSDPRFHLMRRFLIRTIEQFTGQPKLEKLYRQYIEKPTVDDFFEEAVRLLDIDVTFNAEQLSNIPSDGPLVFVANHPYGVLDGIVLTWVCKKVRPDVKVMANSVLCQAQAARNNLLPVDFGGTRDALQTNLATRKTAMETLITGGAVGIFPAGGVGASEKPLKGPAVDPTWHPFAAKLIRKSGATVVPIYFSGQNSRLFQIASHLSYTLRLSLFFFETARRIGSDLDLVVGEPISSEGLSKFEGQDALLTELRKQTYLLAKKRTHLAAGKPSSPVPQYDREFVYPKHFRL